MRYEIGLSDGTTRTTDDLAKFAVQTRDPNVSICWVRPVGDEAPKAETFSESQEDRIRAIVLELLASFSEGLQKGLEIHRPEERTEASVAIRRAREDAFREAARLVGTSDGLMSEEIRRERTLLVAMLNARADQER